MSAFNTTFWIIGLQAPAGSMVRCRFCNGDSQAAGNNFKGTNIIEIPLTELPLLANKGLSDFNGSAAGSVLDSLLLPVNVEARLVTAQTSVAFDDGSSNGASVALACGTFGYAQSGLWYQDIPAAGAAPFQETINLEIV